MFTVRFKSVGYLDDRLALTSERGFFNFKIRGQQQSPIGRDAIAGFDKHNVSWHDFV